MAEGITQSCSSRIRTAAPLHQPDGLHALGRIAGNDAHAEPGRGPNQLHCRPASWRRGDGRSRRGRTGPGVGPGVGRRATTTTGKDVAPEVVRAPNDSQTVTSNRTTLLRFGLTVHLVIALMTTGCTVTAEGSKEGPATPAASEGPSPLVENRQGSFQMGARQFRLKNLPKRISPQRPVGPGQLVVGAPQARQIQSWPLTGLLKLADGGAGDPRWERKASGPVAGLAHWQGNVLATFADAAGLVAFSARDLAPTGYLSLQPPSGAVGVTFGSLAVVEDVAVINVDIRGAGHAAVVNLRTGDVQWVDLEAEGAPGDADACSDGDHVYVGLVTDVFRISPEGGVRRLHMNSALGGIACRGRGLAVSSYAEPLVRMFDKNLRPSGSPPVKWKGQGGRGLVWLSDDSLGVVETSGFLLRCSVARAECDHRVRVGPSPRKVADIGERLVVTLYGGSAIALVDVETWVVAATANSGDFPTEPLVVMPAR